MRTKKKPIGFVATCQCGVVVGAMDYQRTERSDAARLLGKWLADGCTVAPRFSDGWSAQVAPCQCERPRAPDATPDN